MELTNEQAQKIMWLTQKLLGMKVKATFDHIETGPVVTTYYFKPDYTTPVSKIMKLAEDFALAVGEDNLHMAREKGLIALYVPNKDRVIVEFKDNLYWYLTDPEVRKMKLPIPTGLDHRGNKSAFDLTLMPHMLICGSTGSGKSVYESAIIESLALFKTPEELELYLVDTKKVDLPLFEQLPHVKLVADDLAKFHTLMSGLLQECRRRLGVLQGASCRKIDDYHKLGLPMKYIILIVDEFADLADIDAAARKADKEAYEGLPTVKNWIKQLAQIGRAAGIHMICCTQRASVKIIDGDTKTNLPCRVALRLSSRTDSQVVLGEAGAENLLGKGDMLIKRPESDILERFHGPYVKLEDISELVYQYEHMREIFAR